MELDNHDEPKVHQGVETFTVSGGQKIRMKISGESGHRLDVTVPEGKDWEVTVSVKAVEKNSV